jgi:phospholipase D
MNKLSTILLFAITCIFIGAVITKEAQHNVSTCFTPPQSCGDIIVNHINNARESVYIQAYGFTSEKIIKALIEAKNRGVKIEIILDRSNFNRKILNTIKQLNQAEIPVYKDNVKGIAHNKVMIIDGKKVITGSFNFTKNADYRNAENVVIINEKETATRYMHNWSLRILESEKM